MHSARILEVVGVSISRAELHAMDREELIEYVESMDDRLSDLQVVVYEVLKPRLDELEAENDALGSRVEELEADLEAFRDLGAERTSKEQKVGQIVDWARNKADGTGRVTVLPEHVKARTGVTERYAYQLVDDLIDEYDWALDPREQQHRIDETARQKGVLVDLDRLQEDRESLIKFINGSGDKGGRE